MQLVSGIISTHNRNAEIVERALKSILNQTYSHVEIIVVDDSSSDFEGRDCTKSMVESYSDKNVRYIRHSECRGACAARNTGLAEANGEIVGFLDDDDEWLPEKIERMLPYFDIPEVALVYSDWQMCNDDNGSVTNEKTRDCVGYVFDELIMGTNFIGSTSFPLLRKKHLEDIGGFDILMASSQDLDVWLRIAQKYKVQYVGEVLNRYHVHSGERITKSYTKRVKGNERLIEKNLDYLKKHKAAYYSRCVILHSFYALNHQTSDSLRLFFKCCAIRPSEFKSNLKLLYKSLRSFFGKSKG